MVQIRSIKPAKKKQDLFHVQLDEQEYIPVSSLIISQFDLYSGKEISPDVLAQLKYAAEITSLKNYCLLILSKKMYSISEIINKLRKRTKNEALIEKVVSDLKRLNLLNDEEYTELFIRSLKNKMKYSWKEISFRLYQKGIKLDREQYDIEEIEQYETAVIKKLIDKKQKQDSTNQDIIKNRKKVFDYLYKKGFSTEIIKRLLSRSEPF